MGPLPERRTLGATDIEVSTLGVGAWAWGDSFTWGYGRDYGKGDVEAAYRASRESGIDLFDTAEFYGLGQSERLLSEFLRTPPGWAVVATKFFPYPWRLSRSALLQALRRSLKRLGLARVDLYQIHFPMPPVSLRTWAEELVRAVELGLTRAVGVSNYDRRQTEETQRLLEAQGVPLASNQVEFSLLERGPERTGLLDSCLASNVTVIAYSPLAMGLLTGKYTPSHRLPMARRRAFPWVNLARLGSLIQVLEEIGQNHGGKTPGQVALNWVISKGALPIPGAKNAAQARENARALGWRITDDEARHLEQVADRVSAR
jgi:aryl-alcohol dehydrogenase-like predicted oxidoreductase